MRTVIALCLFALSATALAAPRADKVSWTADGKTFDGYLVWDDASKAPRPGLVMVPNWYGVNDKAIAKAKTIAGNDYVVLLADVYGRGVRPANSDEAGKAAGAVYANPDGTPRCAWPRRWRPCAVPARRRRWMPRASARSVSASAARWRSSWRAAVPTSPASSVFHGNLASKLPAAKGAVRAKVLVMNGADDSYVPPEQIAGFQQEMRDAGADWQFVNFGGAVHCFAEPDETTPGGCLFHEPSYRRSMVMMRNFFAEAFAKK